ncbi:hypothetical protein GOODEAATRI_009370, partial [Goodea atripinnis]
RNHAVRIKKLPKGTVSFHTQSEQRFVGVVEKEVVSATNKNASPTKGKEKVYFCTNENNEGPKPVATPRPDRLVNRLKSITLDDASAPRLVILRQPRGPDNTKVQPNM